MSLRNDQALLKDMIGSARTALTAMEGRGFHCLKKDDVWTLGLIKCIEIIGEAAGRMSSEFKSRHAAIPWAAIIGMRNRLVHAYFDIDYEQIWKTLTEDLPPLVEQLQELPADESPGGP